MTSRRERVPRPLLSSRVASGRGATEQPNAGGDGDAALTGTFWCLVVLTGVATGLLADALMGVLFLAQHLAFGVSGDNGSFQAAVEAAQGWQRVTPLLIAGAVAGVGWYLLRRFTPGPSDVDELVWSRRQDGPGRWLAVRRSTGTAVLSEIVIGLGASLGREAAPKLMGGLAGSLLGGWAGTSVGQRRLLVAAGAGAGFAAVYDVPLGGALFAAEVLVGSLSLPTVLPVLACSGIATATAWLTLPSTPTYVDVPDYPFAPRILVWAIVLGPVIGVLAAAYVRLIGWASFHRASGRLLLVAPLLAFAVVAAVALALPQLYGNGRGMGRDAFTGVGTVGLFLALAALKPLVTGLCLGSGASGGVFTPVMSTGAVLGAGLGVLWSDLWPGSPVGSYALVGAAAMIGAAMQAPLAALLLVLELTHSGFALVVPMLVATVLATAVSRWLDGYSIYSARLAPVQQSGP